MPLMTVQIHITNHTPDLRPRLKWVGSYTVTDNFPAWSADDMCPLNLHLGQICSDSILEITLSPQEIVP